MNMKKESKTRALIARVLLLCMLLSVLAVLPTLPAAAAETRLSTDKTTYAVGEPIMVTATGSGKDWVGIFLAGEENAPGVKPSVLWYYVAESGNTSGATKDLYTSEYNNYADWPGFAGSLPAGDYVIALLENDGYNVLESVNITITDAPASEDWELTEEKPLVTNKTTYTEGEPILVKALGSGTDWVGLYLAGETPPTGNPPSIYWFYVEENGHVAGDVVNLKNERFSTDRSEYGDIPAGEYRLVLCTNDTYNVKAEVAITVKAGGASSDGLVAPASATYASAGAGKGRADGKLTITHGGSAPKSYVIRWADANGPLKDYTDVATVACTGTDTVYTMTPGTLIPVGADRLLVYAKSGTQLSEEPAVAMLPAGVGNYDFGTVRQELQVMSDIHINSDDNHPYNRNFAAALREIAKLSPNSSGVFINGDVADLGLADNYAAYKRILKSAGKDLTVIAAMGNHDFYGPKYGGPQMTDAQKIAQFMQGTGNDSETVYFDRVIDGTHFIFLGSEAYQPPNAQLSDTQLNWLEEKLKEDDAEGRPVFVFLHEGIMDTVAGTFAYQGWHGVQQGARLKAILDAHPNAILFSGHSHWVLESPVSFLPSDGKTASYLNTASCAYLWDDHANTTNVGIDGSQGYYIYLYDDCVVFRGRSFTNGAWISTAQFVLPRMDAPEPGTDPDIEPETGTDTEPVTTDLPIDPGTDPADTTVDTSDGTAAPSADSTAAPADGITPALRGEGCASAVSLAALTLFSVLGAAVVLRRRRD